MRVVRTDVARIRGMSVQNVMVREVVTLNAKDKIRVAWLKLMERDISSAPVIDDEGLVVGMLSMSDINRSIMERFRRAKSLRETTQPDADDETREKEETKELSLATRAVTDSSVSSLLPMNQRVLGLGQLDSLDRAIKLMADTSVNCLPVVKDARVVGVISRQDVIFILAGKTRA